jgi:mannosyltransferase OCH1-like enzyme
MDSPRLAVSPSSFRNRVPTQMRRCLPLYFACIFVVLIILNADIFGAISRPRVFKRSAKVSPGLGDSGFPKKIWQTWKMDPFSFDERDSNTAKTWPTKNPGHRYEVLTDSNDMAYVEQYYGRNGLNRIDIVDMYQAINSPIVKADLLRYLVMYAEGGIYADIDVEALRPISRFIPERYNEKDIDLVVGVEIDQPEFKDHPILGQKSQSFCQWTFMARPRLPVMLKLVETIMAWLSDLAREQGVPISEVKLDFDAIITGTGPSAFTTAVLDDINTRNRGPPISWRHFHNMDESKLVNRVLVLDVEAFAAGQGHSDSGNHDSRSALVKHHYHASNWPSRHPRFSHPIFGEVEQCNWDAECVRKWDDDVKSFKALPDDQQQQLIAARTGLAALAAQKSELSEKNEKNP